jgi:opacity protein-like surface antigen
MEVEFSSQGGSFGRACSKNGCAEGQKTALDGDIETKSLLVNAIHFFNTSESFHPYVGYGVGTAFHEATLDEHEDGAQTTFAYQFKTGIELNLNQHINLFTGYRFFTTDEPDFGFFKGDVTTHSFETGIKYHF